MSKEEAVPNLSEDQANQEDAVNQPTQNGEQQEAPNEQSETIRETSEQLVAAPEESESNNNPPSEPTNEQSEAAEVTDQEQVAPPNQSEPLDGDQVDQEDAANQPAQNGEQQEAPNEQSETIRETSEQVVAAPEQSESNNNPPSEPTNEQSEAAAVTDQSQEEVAPPNQLEPLEGSTEQSGSKESQPSDPTEAAPAIDQTIDQTKDESPIADQLVEKAENAAPDSDETVEKADDAAAVPVQSVEKPERQENEASEPKGVEPETSETAQPEKTATSLAETAPKPVKSKPSVTAKPQPAEIDLTPVPPPATERDQTVRDEFSAGRVAAATTPVPADEDEFVVDPHAVSPRSRIIEQHPTETCTVKFRLMPGGQVHTERCLLSQRLIDLKKQLSSELKVPVRAIMLIKDGKETNDYQTLPDLGVVPNKAVDLEIMSADPTNYPIKSFKRRQEYHMPDVITVRVDSDTEPAKDLVVEIERATQKKPFLGGYRHKKNGFEYHHASAQTMQKLRPPPTVERYCRDTQTFQEKNRLQQTANNMATQMTKIGVYVANVPDKLLVPGPYTTADQYRRNILERVIILQKYYRRWLAKRHVERVRQDKIIRLEWEREQERKKKQEKEDRIKNEFNRRMNPKTKEDFDLLYHALEKWRQEELERINAELTGAERKAALCQLLDQETQLIASIGRHKLDADEENRGKLIQGFLEKAASSKKWKGRDGKLTLMDTPYTIRAQELRDIYNSINMKYLTQDERLDVLLTLKHTVKEHDCKLTQEIIELIDREADLLMRGVKESNLEGLRRRISTLFLQYIKTPTFNPEAARLLKVPQDPSVLRKDIYYCPSCNQYKPSTDFQLTSNSSSVGRCRKCDRVDNDARTRQDYSHYRFILKTLRRSEEAYEDASQISFLLQEGDLRYLVENVWNSQSVLSAWDDIYDLVLVRWDKHTEWSPWNCILLTKEEAASHSKLRNIDEAYGKPLVHKVNHKHTLARNYFARIPGMAEFMRDFAENRKPLAPTGIAGKSVTSVKPISSEQAVK